jgi:hypothetical protein
MNEHVANYENFSNPPRKIQSCKENYMIISPGNQTFKRQRSNYSKRNQKTETTMVYFSRDQKLIPDSSEDPRLKMKRRGVPPNKRRRTRGGGQNTTRNAASGVIEIPDDDLKDISQMYPHLLYLTSERTNYILPKLKRLMSRN